MSLVVAIAAGLAVYELTRRTGLAMPAAVLAGLAVWSPPLAVVAGLAAGAFGARKRIIERRVAERAGRDDVPLLAEMVHLGLTAGLTFPAALDLASQRVHPALAAEAGQVLRRGRPFGLAPVLEAQSGMAGRLYVLAARAAVTGAPLLPAVEAFVEEARLEERSQREAEARRLPVRLLLPVALLILPGFVVLTVAPALLSAFERLRF